MMAVELTAVAQQTVASGGNVLFTETAIPCNRGYVVHRNGAGVITLRGITNNCFARYKVAFFGNIGLPVGVATQPIGISITINGEPVPASTAIITAPAASLENVATSIIIDVPKGCCYTIAVRNVSDPATPITVANANLMIDRVA